MNEYQKTPKSQQLQYNAVLFWVGSLLTGESYSGASSLLTLCSRSIKKDSPTNSWPHNSQTPRVSG